MKYGSIKISRFNEGLTVFKPDYYLNEGKKTISDLIDGGFEFDFLQNISDKLYQGGIFKRVFVENKENSFQYITASDMVKNQPLETSKNISKKYTPWIDEMKLNDKQILVSCAGTVGNTTLVNNSFAGCIGSQEIIRIETIKIPYGYLYAYLSTPLVNQYIQSMIYGAVVPRISPEELGRLPILLLKKEKQIEIHNLIVESTNLRVEANMLLNEVHSFFEAFCNTIQYKNPKKKIISINRLDNSLRFSGNYFLCEGDFLERLILDKKHKLISELTTDIFTSGRDKRNYTKKNKGVAFLSNGDISSNNPFKSCNYIVKKSIKERSYIKENMILTGRVGQDTVGKVYYPLPILENSIASDNIIRLVINDKNERLYAFGFLSSRIGKEIIRKRKTGVGQPFITEDMLSNIPIPELDENTKNKIIENIGQYVVKFNGALENELKAIDLIEKEIESWQKS